MKTTKVSSPAQGGPAITVIDVPGELPCTHTALRRAARQLGNLYDQAVWPTELKATQIGLLSQIEKLGGRDGPTLQALAERLAIRISALTHALRPLVRDGLVELRTDHQDKRTKHATLTPAGQTRLAEGITLWASANNRVETVLGPVSAKLLRELADTISSKEFFDAYKSGRTLSAPTS
ncbi:MAG TPA: MarR family winged helix-turn-helix transcriptional regulator [Afipia sp.]